MSVSLGTSVTCNSVGVPTSDGSTVCELYTGNTAYKIQIKDSSAVLVPGFSWDNIIGALDTSGFATTGETTTKFLAKSADYTVQSTDDQTLIEFDTSGGNCTATLPSAVTVASGFLVGLRKKASGNVLSVATNSSQTIRHDTTTGITTYTMNGQGEEIWFLSDGANWVCPNMRVGRVVLGPGTATIKPLMFTSGTLNTTAVAGVMEYDGVAFYASSAASSRQVVDTPQFIMLTADYSLTDTSSAQKAFNSPSSGTLAVQASTTYLFEFEYCISNTGTTSHTWAALIALTTATLTSSRMTVRGRTGTTGATTFTADLSGFTTDVTTALVATAASTSATEFVVLSGRGVLRVNAAGSITPQVKMSAAANGGSTSTEKMLANSWFRLWPVGSNTVASVGNWS